MHTNSHPAAAPALVHTGGQEALRRIQAQARYVFAADEFAVLTGRAARSAAVKQALQRLSRRGLIISASKQPSRWLIVPPEHAHYGAPPVDWWLNDYLKPIEPHYYVALLSAAKYWGSSHYAKQSTQVMVSKPRLALAVGRLRVDFFSKRNIANTPIGVARANVAHWRVSTREATLLDLIRHQSAVGGLEAVARICKDLVPALELNALGMALDALGQVAAAQRLGFIFEQLDAAHAAQKVAQWLAQRRVTIQPLESNADVEGMAVCENSRWHIAYLPSQETILKELR